MAKEPKLNDIFGNSLEITGKENGKYDSPRQICLQYKPL